MKEIIVEGADTVSRFCRLQMNVKRDIPIRPSEMGVLIFIKKNENPVTPLMISSFFGISKPSVTDMVNSLAEKDYVMKKPSEADRRSYTLCATPKGCALVESTCKEYFRAMELLEEKMGCEEFRLFIRLLQKANKVLGEENI